MWGPTVVTGTAPEQPLSMEEVVAHCRAPEDGTDDGILTGCISAAAGMVESMTGARLVTQTVITKADDWADLANLPIAPVQSITSIDYLDTDGEEQSLPSEDYTARLEGLEPSVRLPHGVTWPALLPGSQITLTCVVGYGAPGEQPPTVLHALKIIVGDLYAFRESAQIGSVAGRIPSLATVEALLANHRKNLI